jgi:hypothetical protein
LSLEPVPERLEPGAVAGVTGAGVRRDWGWCRFDDPHLINLDDKVLLHELLTGNTDSTDAKAFWPKGYILPRDELLFKNNTNDEKKE